MGILLIMGMPTSFLYRHKHCLASVLKNKKLFLCVFSCLLCCVSNNKLLS